MFPGMYSSLYICICDDMDVGSIWCGYVVVCSDRYHESREKDKSSLWACWRQASSARRLEI